MALASPLSAARARNTSRKRDGRIAASLPHSAGLSTRVSAREPPCISRASRSQQPSERKLYALTATQTRTQQPDPPLAGAIPLHRRNLAFHLRHRTRGPVARRDTGARLVQMGLVTGGGAWRTTRCLRPERVEGISRLGRRCERRVRHRVLREATVRPLALPGGGGRPAVAAVDLCV